MVKRDGRRIRAGMGVFLPLYNCCKHVYKTQDAVQEAFWRTMVADRAGSARAPNEYGHMFQVLCRLAEPPEEFYDGDPKYRAYAYAHKFVNSLSRFIPSRRMFLSGKGYLGLGPAPAQKGDVLCVI
jgi:hypothetical protein